MELFKPDLEVMATYSVLFNEQMLKVDLVQCTTGSPQFYFHVHLPGNEHFLTKGTVHNETVWLGRMGLEESKKLGELIEDTIGFELPKRETDNPFEYKGDRTVKIESFKIDIITIDRAKAPFSANIYYQIRLTRNRTIVMVRSKLFDSFAWTLEDPDQLSDENYVLFKGMLEGFEKGYVDGIYTPFKIIQK